MAPKRSDLTQGDLGGEASQFSEGFRRGEAPPPGGVNFVSLLPQGCDYIADASLAQPIIPSRSTDQKSIDWDTGIHQWPAMAGHGRPWLAMAGRDRPW